MPRSVSPDSCCQWRQHAVPNEVRGGTSLSEVAKSENKGSLCRSTSDRKRHIIIACKREGKPSEECQGIKLQVSKISLSLG